MGQSNTVNALNVPVPAAAEYYKYFGHVLRMDDYDGESVAN